MHTYTYYWINVFTTAQDKGNPLPVFILDKPLAKHSMQQIATLMNQAETVFIDNAQSDLPICHIYTPMQELPFAGHPIIGALEILQNIGNNAFKAILTKAGHVDISLDNLQNIYWIKAPVTPTIRPSTLDIALTSQMLGLTPHQIKHAPVWMNTGSEQLIVELNDNHAIDSINIDIELFAKHATLYAGRCMIYLWAHHGSEIYARYLYLKNGSMGEDSGTGSACANLGGYQVLQGQSGFEWRICQACHIQQESILFLKVTADKEIWIGGQNRLMGRGEIYWEN